MKREVTELPWSGDASAQPFRPRPSVTRSAVSSSRGAKRTVLTVVAWSNPVDACPHWQRRHTVAVRRVRHGSSIRSTTLA